MYLWPRKEWEAFLTTSEGQILTDGSCAQIHESQAGGFPLTVVILPPIEFPGGADQGPNESDCNFARRRVGMVDDVIGVIEFDDVVVQIRQRGYAESLSEMQSLLQQLRPR